MQCADVFYLKADICQLGLDQRKVNMLARDYCPNPIKPIILSHHMLLGLKEGQTKQSKSDPMSAIFMEDSEKDVIKKINKGFCPEKVVEENPIMDMAKFIVFPAYDDEFTLEIRKDDKKIIKTYKSYQEFEADYITGEIHPSDLKPAVASAINRLLQPVREHFQNDPFAKNLLETIKKW